MSNVALQKPLNSTMVISKSGIDIFQRTKASPQFPTTTLQAIAPWGWGFFSVTAHAQNSK